MICPFPTVRAHLHIRDWERSHWPWPIDKPDLTHLPITVGKEHCQTYDLIQEPVSLLHFDAHVDADEFDGKMHHGNWITRLLREDKLLDVYQVGIRCGVHRPFNSCNAWEQPDLDYIRGMRGPVYVSIDLDVFDPSVAPATGMLVPGGLSTNCVRRTLFALRGIPVIAGDIMEFEPALDGTNNLTAALVAALVFDLAYLIEAG